METVKEKGSRSRFVVDGSGRVCLWGGLVAKKKREGTPVLSWCAASRCFAVQGSRTTTRAARVRILPSKTEGPLRRERVEGIFLRDQGRAGERLFLPECGMCLYTECRFSPKQWPFLAR